MPKTNIQKLVRINKLIVKQSELIRQGFYDAAKRIGFKINRLERDILTN